MTGPRAHTGIKYDKQGNRIKPSKIGNDGEEIQPKTTKEQKTRDRRRKLCTEVGIDVAIAGNRLVWWREDHGAALMALHRAQASLTALISDLEAGRPVAPTVDFQ